jgi:hypothetical protein
MLRLAPPTIRPFLIRVPLALSSVFAYACSDPTAQSDGVDEPSTETSSTGGTDDDHEDTGDSSGSESSGGSDTDGSETTGDPNPCPEDAPTWCEHGCTDTTYDFLNCGACGVECGDFDFCVEGTCTLHCWEGWVECAGTCVPAQDLGSVCGLCDAPCPEGWVCDDSCVDTREWTTPTLITPPCEPQVEPLPPLCPSAGLAQVAIDPDGNAIVVWQQAWQVWARRYDAGTDAWEAPGPIESNPDDAMTPHVAMDDNGNGIALWVQTEGFSSSLWANRYDATIGGWGTPQMVAASVVGQHQITMTGAGDAFVVWWSPGQVGFNRYDAANAAWGTASEIPPVNGEESAIAPQIAASSGGEVVAVWRQPVGGIFMVAGSRYDSGTMGWTPSELLEVEDGIGSQEARLAMGSNGDAVAVWWHGPSMRANRLEVGAPGWSGAEVITSSGSSPPHAAMDASGNVMVVGTSNYDFKATRYDAFAVQWAEQTSPYDMTSHPRVGLDAAGNGVAVWSYFYTNLGIWAGRYDVWGDSWEASERIDNDDEAPRSNWQVAVNAKGHAVAVWSQGNAVWANRLR